MRLLEISTVVGCLTLTSISAFAATTCEPGFQAYGERCVSQKMSDYIFCVEATGGNKQEIGDLVSSVSRDSLGGEVTGKGSGIVVSGSGSVKLDKSAEQELVRKLETKFFPGATSECAKVLEAPSAQGAVDLSNAIAARMAGRWRSEGMTTREGILIVSKGRKVTITEFGGSGSPATTMEGAVTDGVFEGDVYIEKTNGPTLVVPERTLFGKVQLQLSDDGKRLFGAVTLTNKRTGIPMLSQVDYLRQ